MTNPARTLNVMRYGSDAPLPERRALRAGPLHLVLEGGDLRYVRFGDHEIVRRLYVAIRDRNWDTIPPNYTRYEIDDRGDAFRVDLAVEHVSADVDFAWTGWIEGTSQGTITYVLEGAPRKPFLRNRIGFCVLHPSDLAGVPAIVHTPDGVVERPFPDLISPHQPFIDIIAIAHPAGPDATATIAFEGDLFEMEDQRNWTDASYKTYSTPLRLPYPVEVGPADFISQRVVISVSGEMGGEAKRNHDNAIAIDFGMLSPLPSIGFGAGMGGTIADGDMDRFRALRPAHLWESIDLDSGDWRSHLDAAAGRARELGISLDLAVTAARDGGWDQLASEIVAGQLPVGRLFVFPAVDAPVTFPRFDLATHPETIDAARAAFAGTKITLGGGARAYFTELNRATDFLPVDRLDAVTYTINPQVHATDNLSVIETLTAQGETVRSARQIAGDKPLIVGPVTLQPPWNPNATGPAPETPPGQLPPAVDARQMSLLGAGWTLGSVHRLASAGADALTYFELYGWRGLIERRHDLTCRGLFPSEPGQLFPLYHVFAALADFAGGSLGGVTISEPFAAEALAVRNTNRVRLLVASFAGETTDIVIEAPGIANPRITMLDETTWNDASDDPDFLRRGGGAVLDLRDGTGALTLLPFAVACIDADIAG